jgi:hypothetical protein
MDHCRMVKEHVLHELASEWMQLATERGVGGVSVLQKGGQLQGVLGL